MSLVKLLKQESSINRDKSSEMQVTTHCAITQGLNSTNLASANIRKHENVKINYAVSIYKLNYFYKKENFKVSESNFS